MALDNMKTVKISVGVVATQIVAANYKRKDLVIYNNGSENIYIDNTSGDCTLDSFPLLPGKALVLDRYQGEIHGIVAAATEEIRVLYTQY